MSPFVGFGTDCILGTKYTQISITVIPPILLKRSIPTDNVSAHMLNILFSFCDVFLLANTPHVSVHNFFTNTYHVWHFQFCVLHVVSTWTGWKSTPKKVIKATSSSSIQDSHLPTSWVKPLINISRALMLCAHLIAVLYTS